VSPSADCQKLCEKFIRLKNDPLAYSVDMENKKCNAAQDPHGEILNQGKQKNKLHNTDH